ncbi:hypothetical protein DSUL_50213 [Desulfovibrionales bacterium]
MSRVVYYQPVFFIQGIISYILVLIQQAVGVAGAHKVSMD